VPYIFTFSALDAGMAAGIFAKHGLEIESLGFPGGSRMHQAMSAGALDMGIGAGAEMALIAKGSPAMTVASMYGAPVNVGVIVAYDSPIKSIADLKGKRIGVASTASLTYWLCQALSRSQGWGQNGLEIVTLAGSMESQIAALKLGQVDAVMGGVGTAFKLEEAKAGRLLVPASDFVGDFITHVIFAHNDLIKSNPDAIRRFLAAWFETLAYMRDHKSEAVTVAAKVTGLPPSVEAREYDLEMSKFSRDGRFDPKALEVLGSSFVPLGMLDKVPDMKTLYTEDYLPKR
jgi:ABC-type nitrate/sulfonate/bicarbonate transport system substrate-binding protein